MKYKNNTNKKISYDSQFNSRNITLEPGEEKEIDFYIDPTKTEFTLIDDSKNIDPFLLYQDYTITDVPTYINIPKPKGSPYIRISIIPKNPIYLSFNNITNNRVYLIKNATYYNTFVWEYTPILILTAVTSAIVNVFVEEIYII